MNDIALFQELYDVHPQAIVWMRPLQNEGSKAIHDFEYTYCNDEGLRYLGVTREQLTTLKISNTPSLPDSMRQQVLAELVDIYNKGEKVETTTYNPVLKKYVHYIRTRLRNGILSIIQDKTEMHQNLRQLESQSHFLNSVLNSSPGAVVTMEAVRSDGGAITDFRYRQANQQFLSWMMKTEREVIGGTMLELFPNTRDTGIFDIYTRVIDTGKPIRTEVQYHAGSKTLWYDLSAVKLDEKSVVGTFNDITERKKAMELITQQKTLLDNILTYSSNGISVTEAIRDADGRVIDARTLVANKAAVNFTGLPLDIYLTKTAVEIDPNILSSDYYKIYTQTLETGQPAVLQYYLEHTGRWLELSISRMDADHIIHIFTDVTSVKNAQLALERSATQLQTIINRTQSGIFTAVPVCDAEENIVDFRFVIVNRALSAYVQQTPEALVGQLGSQWFSGYKENGLFQLFCDTYQNHTVNRFDHHYLADGIDAWIDMMCTRFDDELMVTFTDYTPVKKLQLELEQSVEELRRSNTSLQEFAYAASHDLQEPLRKISTFADRLKWNLQAQLNEENQRLFDRMALASARMKTLIEDLLSYSEVSVKPVEFGPVDLNTVLQQVLQDLEASITDSGALVHTPQLPQIHGDAPQMRQMFQNLIGNAIKYRKPGVAPEVTLQCHLLPATDPIFETLPPGNAGAFYKLTIKDNGIGFDQVYAEKIFQVFQRLHSNAEYKGTGVGLAIVQKVVTNHRGFVWAKGAPGEGACFHVLLPA